MASVPPSKRRISRRRSKHSVGALFDPNMVWQTYRACKQRDDVTGAYASLAKYVSLSLESAASNSGAIRFRLHDHLLPSLAFEETSVEWILKQRPSGLLPALEDLARYLMERLRDSPTATKANHVCDREGEAVLHLTQQLLLLTRMLTKIVCCSENLPEIRQSNMFEVCTEMGFACFHQIANALGDEDCLKALLESCANCVAFLHLLLDPHHNWLSAISQQQPMCNPTLGEPMVVKSDVLKLFQLICSELPRQVAGKDCEGELQYVLLETLHLLGGILSAGSMPNCQLAVTMVPDTLLFSLLEPRETCSPLQVLTLHVSIQMIHTLYCFVPEETLTNIDVRVFLSALFMVLCPRFSDGTLSSTHPELAISLLNLVEVLANPPGQVQEFREVLVNLAVMEKIAEVLNTYRNIGKESPGLGVRICHSALRALGHVMRGSPLAQDAFDLRVGYQNLQRSLSSTYMPTQEVLTELLSMVIESEFKIPVDDSMIIQNSSVVSMLLRWLPHLASSLQSWLSLQLFELCTSAVHNKQNSCSSGLLRVIVEVLAGSQMAESTLDRYVEAQLIELVEVLGSHSIVAAELKQMIGALRTTESGYLPSYYYQLQQALCAMARNKEGLIPLSYFDLRQLHTHIIVPGLKQWPNTAGFSFHTWVCLDPPGLLRRSLRPEMGVHAARRRRILYSFYSKGQGYEAFFTESMSFVVAATTRKDFHTYTLSQSHFRASEWFSIGVTHQVNKRWGRCEVVVYINGSHIGSGTIKASSMSDKSFQNCYIGSSHNYPNVTSPSHKVELTNSGNSLSDSEAEDEMEERNSLRNPVMEGPVRTVAIANVNEEWGVASHLGGLLSSVTLFSDVVPSSTIKTIYHYGPNNLSLFQPRCSQTQEFASKVLLYYHPKACRDETCVDLAPLHVHNNRLDGIFTGQPYVTWDIRDVLGSIGGVELLFPILEQVGTPVRPFNKEGMASPSSDSLSQDLVSTFNQKEGATAFLKLLLVMLDGCPTNQEVFFRSDGPATIAALLQKVCPQLLTPQFLLGIKQLTDLFHNHKSHLHTIHHHILFNFGIWSRPAFEVRKEHIQYLSTIITTNPSYCREEFGVQFILDVVRIYYSHKGSTEPSLLDKGTVGLSEEEEQGIRAALLNALKLYVMDDITRSEFSIIISFLTFCKDPALLEELLRLLQKLLTNNACAEVLGNMLWTNGLPLLVFVQAENVNVRLLAIKIISHLVRSYGHASNSVISQHLQNGSLAAAVSHMAQYEVPSSIILALLELCTSQNRPDYTEHITNFSLYMAVLQLLRSTPLVVRHTVCQQVNSLLTLNPIHITEMASRPGWESLFLWLLCPLDKALSRKGEERSTLSEDDDTSGDASEAEMLAEEEMTTTGRGNGKEEPDTLESLSESKPEEGRPQDYQRHDEGGDPTDSQDIERDPFAEGEVEATTTDNLTDQATHSLEEPDRFSVSKKKKKVRLRPHRQRSLQVTSPRSSFPSYFQLFPDDDTWRTFNIVTKTIGYILWHYTDSDCPPWMTWGHMFASIDDFAAGHKLIVPVHVLKQRLFSLLINAITLESSSPNISKSSLIEGISHLTQLFELFVICSYPSAMCSGNIDEVEQSTEGLRGSLSKVVLQLNVERCTKDLLGQFLDMLNSVGLIGSQFVEPVELGIIESTMRVLLACISCTDPNYYVVSAAKIQSIVQTGNLPHQDALFMLYHLGHTLQQSIKLNSSEDHTQHVAAAMRGLFLHYSDMDVLQRCLPSLPDPSNSPSFRKELISYTQKQDWVDFMDTLAKQVTEYYVILFPWLSSCAQRRMECMKAYNESEQSRKKLICENLQKYQENVLTPFFELRDAEDCRQKTLDSLRRNDLSEVHQQWRSTRRFFTGERGVWSNRKAEQFLWKLSRTENYSRMRMKLAKLYTRDFHHEAARLRDQDSSQQADNLAKADKTLLAKATRTGTMQMDYDDFLDTLPQDGGVEGQQQQPAEEEAKEKLIRTERCDLILLMDRVSGRLEVTTHNLYFFADHNEKRDNNLFYTTSIKVPHSELREIHSRRYNMSYTGMEIFLIDQTNHFFNFKSRKMFQRVYRSIKAQPCPSLNRIGVKKPSELLHAAGLTEKWRTREIGNFDYLMQLNTIAGRTYNDLNQYPIFPWVLRDYHSDVLDLSNEAVYRNFTWPMGAQNPKLRENLEIKYRELEDVVLGKFHHGSHYSNAAGVLHYLIRLEPFTTLHIELQSGRFDYSDRQFFSIPNTWDNVYRTGSDVKELTPEFFFLPEFLTNTNKLDLGKRQQTNTPINDVILPKWATSAEDFVQKNRDALESDYVSEHLNEWIDLIFGYKQSGPEAEKALNVFMKYCYEEHVNLDEIQDIRERRQIESMINNFGQTPTKLFATPHPKRLTWEQVNKVPSKGYLVAGRRLQQNLFDHLSHLKAHSVDVAVANGATDADPVIFVGTPTFQTRALLLSGNPEQLVTVTSSGLLNIHGWLPFSNIKNRPFTFQFDPNAHFDRSRWQFVGAPFAQDITVNPRLFLLSPNNKLLVTGGHWDNSFRVFSIDKTRLLARINYHNDVVTCMALDKAGTGEHLITGSRDTTSVVWKFSSNSFMETPLVTLYGHDSEVLCVDISTELDMAVSGAKDGACIIHTIRTGQYMHTLRPRQHQQCEIRQVAISSHGRIVVYSQEPEGKRRSIVCAPCLHLYSLNGKVLVEKELIGPLNDFIIVDKYIITGNDQGYLTFRELNTLKQLNCLRLLVSIRCISVVLDHTTKTCTHLLVGLKSGQLIIVSVRN